MKSPIKLARPLVLEDRVMTPDGAGGFAVSWNPLGILYGQVVARTGKEREIAGRMVSSNAFKITVRAAPIGAPSRPRADQRLRDGTRLYSLIAVAENSESDLYLDCWATEGTGE